MVIRIASVYVRQGKAYLPVVAQTETELFIETEPVYTAGLTSDDLVAALEKVLAAGHPKVPTPTTKEEFHHLFRTAPVLRVAQVKSWKELSQHCAVYKIEWAEQAVTVYIVQLDHLGRAEFASAKRLAYGGNVPLRVIVEGILKDVQSRPELQQEESSRQ